MGRPKKTILLVHANEAERGMQRIVLEVHGYRVLVAHDAASALALHDLGVDLVLGFAADMSGQWAELAERMKAGQPLLPVLVIVPPRCRDGFSVAPQADCVYTQPAMLVLLEIVRMRLARKRGPRKLPEHGRATVDGAKIVTRNETDCTVA